MSMMALRSARVSEAPVAVLPVRGLGAASLGAGLRARLVAGVLGMHRHGGE
jgi:hypothetical protein